MEVWSKIWGWRMSWHRNSHTSGESVSATQWYPARIPLAPAFRGSPTAFARARKVCGGLGETSIAISRLCGGFVHVKTNTLDGEQRDWQVRASAREVNPQSALIEIK
ncbi:hypothetical protein D2Q93_09320 [Alicyclobacillaceae bacterium I2511]|nr:hypothetical protein D2Q93_09320 [Alicyclobacillaceae bacterium I2511]